MVNCYDGQSSPQEVGSKLLLKVEDFNSESSLVLQPDCHIHAQDMFNCKDYQSSSAQEVGFLPKIEECGASSSCKLKSHFVGMGFAPVLVDKVIDEHGDEDIDLLLESLLTYSKSSSNLQDFQAGLVSSCKENNDSPVEYSTDDSLGLEEFDENIVVSKDKRESLLLMNFSAGEVESAIKRFGEDAPFAELIDFIIGSQKGVGIDKKNTCDSFFDEDVKNVKVITTETLFGTREKTLRLLEMGFTGDEVSAAIERFGPDVPLQELADSIFAYQIARNSTEDDKKPSDFITKIPSRNENTQEHGNVGNAAEDRKRSIPHSKIEETGALGSSDFLHEKGRDYSRSEKVKKTKFMNSDGKSSFCVPKPEPGAVKSETESYPMPDPYVELPESAEQPLKFEVPDQSMPRNLHPRMTEPPYFFYGNVLNISETTWEKISQFLYGIQPEFVNCQFFSALSRKEGYVHNLPTANRSHIDPQPPMTIEDALPHTRKWWPSWDTRKQLSCIMAETTGVTQICKQLEMTLVNTQGVLSKEQQANILHQCKRLNLIWVDKYKLSPIEAHQVESILGYPVGHTQIDSISSMDRLRILKYSFQTDTLGYHLSSLKSVFPDGLTVLSLFGGIGGVEVALHKLGIRLKCVVSVDPSTVNREILARWWSDSGQTGELRLFDDIQKLTSKRLEGLVAQFGGFDIVIAANPSSHVFETPKMSSSGVNPVGFDFGRFYEFVRIYQRVRSMLGRNR